MAEYKKPQLAVLGDATLLIQGNKPNSTETDNSFGIAPDCDQDD
jgi:hypothetical protein